MNYILICSLLLSVCVDADQSALCLQSLQPGGMEAPRQGHLDTASNIHGVNRFRSEPNGQRSANDMPKYNSTNKNLCVFIQSPLNFVLMVRIDKKS